MTTTHTNLALVEGEVHIFSKSEATQSDYLNILASTAKLEGVPQLDRKHFVKPKVDVHLEAVKEYWKDRNVNEDDYIDEFVKGFKACHNGKEAEFTREEAKILFKGTSNYPNMSFEEAVNLLRPLSLPASVTLNENNEVISVEW